ncbi:ATP-grasp domain-containing protein [Anaerocolumna sp. AGMB13020]|uniref:ATP-grasp domain-containing protein n=1 Tax=Anaerocolumna sp. AGMB13020 TaxID=3081750 RepID=UPI002954F22E|nr:ATP-grasp domain-containing protein [Anaerocolumna sp. AGMB13020]WOO36828.1 ATP-grasp domain-containing protein [Anaerocolumna sp. AGMB13020]
MTGWLIYGQNDAKKNKGYIDFYMAEGKSLGINIELLFRENIEVGIRDNSWFIRYNGKDCIKPDFAIVRTIYPLLSKQLEYLSIPVFNSSEIARICNDKAKTYQCVAELSIPIINTTFVENNAIRKRLENIIEPTVIKTVSGHGGSQVYLSLPKCSPAIPDPYKKIRHSETAREEIIAGIRYEDCVMQPFIPGKQQDLRVYVIGKEIITAILRTSNEGFRANFSLGGNVREYELSRNEIITIRKIIDHFEFGMVGIDFLIGDEGELIFNEIEDVVGARMLYQCTDINLVKRYLMFVMDCL